MFYINKKQKKVLFVATVVKTHINVFHLPYLEMFKKRGFKTYVCAKNDFENKEECIIPYCDEYYDVPFERSPFKFKNIQAYMKLKKIIEEEKFDIIHCHTPVASILTRVAAIKSRKYRTKVIYTAHGFHFFKGASLINWLIYYPIEKICSYFTDVLITINKEDYNLAMKKMKANKIYHVPGVGIDINKYLNIDIDEGEKRKELGITKDDIMILSIGEISKRKNHEVVIRALAEIEETNVHYFIAGRGNLKKYLLGLCTKLNIQNRVHFLGFRSDIDELCKVSDIFSFPSKQEGLPVALMEAMACGLPVICSDIRGNNDLVKEGINGFLCDYDSVGDFKKAIEILIYNESLKEQFSINNKNIIVKFDIKSVVKEMKKIYEMDV